jgi:hypothetical protein
MFGSKAKKIKKLEAQVEALEFELIKLTRPAFGTTKETLIRNLSSSEKYDRKKYWEECLSCGDEYLLISNGASTHCFSCGWKWADGIPKKVKK